MKRTNPWETYLPVGTFRNGSSFVTGPRLTFQNRRSRRARRRGRSRGRGRPRWAGTPPRGPTCCRLIAHCGSCNRIRKVRTVIHATYTCFKLKLLFLTSRYERNRKYLRSALAGLLQVEFRLARTSVSRLKHSKTYEVLRRKKKITCTSMMPSKTCHCS